jgi:hypothetical protein
MLNAGHQDLATKQQIKDLLWTADSVYTLNSDQLPKYISDHACDALRLASNACQVIAIAIKRRTRSNPNPYPYPIKPNQTKSNQTMGILATSHVFVHGRLLT